MMRSARSTSWRFRHVGRSGWSTRTSKGRSTTSTTTTCSTPSEQAPGRELVRQWLKAGYVDRGVFHSTDAGTPQGGVISPLLANIALHGMEDALGVAYNGRGESCSKRAVVRYADDFVVFCESREDALMQSTFLLMVVGLVGRAGTQTLKGKDAHRPPDRRVRLPRLQRQALPAPTTSRTGYKLLIKPSKASVRRIRTELRQRHRTSRACSFRARGCRRANASVRYAPVRAVHLLDEIAIARRKYVRVNVHGGRAPPSSSRARGGKVPVPRRSR